MNIKDFIVYSGTSLRDALKQIDRNHKGLIVICNKKNQVQGISTDGDIRRQLLINDDIDQIIDNSMNKDFVYAKVNSYKVEIY